MTRNWKIIQALIVALITSPVLLTAWVCAITGQPLRTAGFCAAACVMALGFYIGD